jgi:hypothetical protein
MRLFIKAIDRGSERRKVEKIGRGSQIHFTDKSYTVAKREGDRVVFEDGSETTIQRLKDAIR